MGTGDRSLAHLHGEILESVTPDPETQDWVFALSGGMALRVAAPWRLVSDGQIVVGWEDDGQPFGLPQPCDARQRCASLVSGRRVESAIVGPLGDLVVRVEGGTVVEVFNASCGYEGWQLHGPGERWLVAQGGGRVVNSGG